MGGGDGELLWNIYYGEYAVDDRFDAFRNAQLWNADVIRPIIEGDVKYQRFQLAHESLNASGQQNAFRLADYQWLLLAAAVMVSWQLTPRGTNERALTPRSWTRKKPMVCWRAMELPATEQLKRERERE